MKIVKTKTRYAINFSNSDQSDIIFKDLLNRRLLRLEAVKLMYSATKVLYTKIHTMNGRLEEKDRLHPVVLVKRNRKKHYEVKCFIDDREYLGTILTEETIKNNPFITMRLLDLLYEDHKHLSHIEAQLKKIRANEKTAAIR